MRLVALVITAALIGSAAFAQIGTEENLAGMREFCLMIDVESDTVATEPVVTFIRDLLHRQAELFGFPLSVRCLYVAGPGEELTQGIIYVTTSSRGSAVTTQMHVIDALAEKMFLASVWMRTALDGDTAAPIRQGIHASQAETLFEELVLDWRSVNQ